jgi:hypothetical protein
MKQIFHVVILCAALGASSAWSQDKPGAVTVEGIDYDTRTVSVRGPAGELRRFAVSEGVENLDKLQVGNTVGLRVTEAMAMEMLLKEVPTGTVRVGMPLTKTILQPSEDAPKVSSYLKARATGRSRKAVMAELDIDWSETTLIGMEWNALT